MEMFQKEFLRVSQRAVDLHAARGSLLSRQKISHRGNSTLRSPMQRGSAILVVVEVAIVGTEDLDVNLIMKRAGRDSRN